MKYITALSLVSLSFTASAQIYAPSQTILVTSNPVTGFVGIGTSTPQAKLEVAGGGNFIGGRLYQTGDLPNDNNSAVVNTSTSGYGLYSKGGLSNRYAFHFENQSGATVMLGNSYGIGVGTTSPQYRLDVVGNGNFSNGLDVQGPINFTGGRLSQSGDLPNDNNAALVNTSTSGYGFYSQGGGNSKYAFHFLNQAGGTVLYGSGNGNVGIGTYYPDATLTVKGSIHTEEVRVDLNVPAPDYVFEKDYNLLSLSELAVYVDQNKHLPEIPSGKEMGQNGLNLKQMSMLLLKKVEELTLHLIEQNKRMELLEAKIKSLKTK